jgi:ADP-L-glycero-D-manno-heptose 6-epimerase
MILVTGYKGFIGSRMIDRLNKLSHECLGLDLDEFYQNKNGKNKLWKNDLQLFLKLQKPDIVFHIGACSDTQNFDVNYMMELNVEATMIIADYCQKSGAKLIYSSSASCYGTDGLRPNTLYGWSKYLGEKYSIRTGGIALRYYNVYGYTESHKGKMSSMIYQCLSNAEKSIPIKLFPKYPKRDFIFVEDVINANLKAFNQFDMCKGNVFDVGTGNARAFEDVANIIGNKYSYTSELEIPNNYQFFTQADENNFLPNWKAEYSIEDGIRECKQYFTII